MENTKMKPEDYGGQAVIEGVMMRSKSRMAMAIRKPNNEIELVQKEVKPISNKYPILKLPILRGIVAFVDSLVMGMGIITQSAEIALEEEGAKNEKSNEFFSILTVVIAVAFSVAFFMLLPLWLGGLINGWLQGNNLLLAVMEGLIRVLLFVLYIALISMSKDIHRVFEYHGAEHKVINCYESGQSLSVETVRLHTRLHKRCGTSFLLLVMLISLILFLFIRTDVIWLRFASRILLVPFIAGLSFEVIKWAGRSSSPLVSLVSYPGLCLQRMTTKEPDDSQLEVAITALKAILDDKSKSGEPA